MIAILTGPVGGGKTTFLKRIALRLPDLGIAFDGYASERVTAEGKDAGYDLLDLRRGERRPFLRREGPPGGEAVGRFVMDPNGRTAAEAIIRRCRPSEWLLLDELGRLELAGRGVWSAARPALRNPSRSSLIIVRETLLDAYLAGPLADQTVRVFPCSKESDPEAFLRDLFSSRFSGERRGGPET